MTTTGSARRALMLKSLAWDADEGQEFGRWSVRRSLARWNAPYLWDVPWWGDLLYILRASVLYDRTNVGRSDETSSAVFNDSGGSTP